MPVNVLLVDDEPRFLEQARVFLQNQDLAVSIADNGEEAIQKLKEFDFDAVVLDLHMPKISGTDVLRSLRGSFTPVIMLTGGGTIQNAVECLKLGAYDFKTKPVKLDELHRLILHAVESRHLTKENIQLREVLKRKSDATSIVGRSDVMLELKKLINKVADSDLPVLIEGESGTGKELVANEIHRQSRFHKGPKVDVNCAAISESIIESELFGHEKGAFTGAEKSRHGLFGIANGGTLFIDEFGEMPPNLQTKLLRVIENRSYRPVGSTKTHKTNFRLIAATNRSLREEVVAGNFREDLFYRVNVLAIKMPPLRERKGDIELLTKHFAGNEWHIEKGVLDQFESYTWPGNVRQLKNIMARAMVLADDFTIELRNIPPEIQQASQKQSDESISTAADRNTLNRQHFIETYERCGRNKTKTAQALGIHRRTVYRLLKRYGMT